MRTARTTRKVKLTKMPKVTFMTLEVITYEFALPQKDAIHYFFALAASNSWLLLRRNRPRLPLICFKLDPSQFCALLNPALAFIVISFQILVPVLYLASIISSEWSLQPPNCIEVLSPPLNNLTSTTSYSILSLSFRDRRPFRLFPY